SPRFPHSGIECGLAVAFFPLVGLGIGALQAAVLRGARELWPPVFAATLAWLAGVLLSLAEIDGLGDFADAFVTQGLPRSTEETLRILKDPHLGAMGTIAIVAVLGMELVATTQLEVGRATVALCTARMFSRWAMLLVLFRGTPVHDKSTMRLWIENLRTPFALASTLFVAALSVLFIGVLRAAIMAGLAPMHSVVP